MAGAERLPGGRYFAPPLPWLKGAVQKQQGLAGKWKTSLRKQPKGSPMVRKMQALPPSHPVGCNTQGAGRRSNVWMAGACEMGEPSPAPLKSRNLQGPQAAPMTAEGPDRAAGEGDEPKDRGRRSGRPQWGCQETWGSVPTSLVTLHTSLRLSLPLFPLLTLHTHLLQAAKAPEPHRGWRFARGGWTE